MKINIEIYDYFKKKWIYFYKDFSFWSWKDENIKNIFLKDKDLKKYLMAAKRYSITCIDYRAKNDKGIFYKVIQTVY